MKGSLEANIENYRFREALKDAMNIARIGNKYLADTEPWKVIKTDSGRVKTILNICVADYGQYGDCHRAFHAFLGVEDPEDARRGEIRMGAPRGYGSDRCRA